MLKAALFFIKNHRITNMVVAVVFLAGIFSMISLQREELPHVKMGLVKITTRCPGAAAGDVEINVTGKIEDQLASVENIKKTTSISMENMSIITAEIDEGGNDERVVNDIRDAVSRATDLPAAVRERPLVEEITSDYPLIEIALTGEVPETDLRSYARDLETRLREVRGIGGIEKIGYRKREVGIKVNAAKMKDLMISFKDILGAVGSRNVRTTGGTIESLTSEKKIVTTSEYREPLDLRGVIVRSNYEGFQVRLTDVAAIGDGFEDARVLYRAGGRPAIAFLMTKQESADIIDLSDEVREILREYRRTLPDAVRVEEVYDFSVLTRTMLEIVVNNALLGFILVLAVMYVFLDWKSAFWSAAGIPFSVMGAMVLFIPLGININTVALGSLILVIGIIVDDAIVISEKIFTLKQEGLSGEEASLTGVRLMMVPVSAATITTVLAFLPVLFIPGIMGLFMRQIPLVITATLLISLAEAFLFIPAHLRNASPPRREPRRIAWLGPLLRWYREMIFRALKRRKRVMAGFILVLLSAGAASFLLMEFRLDEDIDPDYFAVVAEAPRGTSLNGTAAMVSDVENIVRDTVPRDALKSFAAQVGHHNMYTNYIAPGGEFTNHAIITVYLVPAAQRSVTSEKIMDEMKPKLAALKRDKGFLRLEAKQMGFETGRAVEVTYSGDDKGVVDSLARETRAFLEGIDGVTGVESDSIRGKDEVRIRLDYRMLARMGLTALDVAETVRTAYDGTVATSVRLGDEDIDYRIRMSSPGGRERGILELPVSNSEGRLIQLKHVALLEEGPGTAAVHHFNGLPSVTVTADTDDKKITSARVNRMIRERFEKRAASLPNLHMKLGGEEEETSISMRGFYFALIVALVSIYFILVVLFNSYLQPLLIMSVIPFAVASVFLTLILHHRPLVFISLVGLLGLMGVVVNDTIVLISHLNDSCKKKGMSPETIADGAMERFRPIILTTLTTFAGLMPTAYGLGGDLPMIRPLVLVMGWGLVFSTAVTLGFVPLLYSYVRVKGNE